MTRGLKHHKQGELEPENLLDSVRAGFHRVAGEARHVSINHERLKDLAGHVRPVEADAVLDDTHHFTGTPEETASYILTLDSINFGSGYVPHLLAEGWALRDKSFYFTMSSALKHVYEQQGPLTAGDLGDFNRQSFLDLTVLNTGGRYSLEFADLCVASMNELGRTLETGYGGSFTTFVDSADGHAEALVRQLVAMPSWQDVHDYRGHRVPFYKRAQIAAADLHLAFNRFGRPLFSDLETLTMFPDNAVPHVLRVDGVLEYTGALADRIDNGIPLESGAEEEIEIRACAGEAVEIMARFNKMRAMDVDHFLWHKSVEEPRYRTGRTHRTLSPFY